MSEKSFNIILSNREGGPELFKEIVGDIYGELQLNYHMLSWTDTCKRESNNDLVYKLEARKGWADGLDLKLVYSNSLEDVNVTIDSGTSFDMLVSGIVMMSSIVLGALIASAAAWEEGVVGPGTFFVGGLIGLVIGAILAVVSSGFICYLCIPKRFRERNKKRVDKVHVLCKQLAEKTLNPELPEVIFSDIHGQDGDWITAAKDKASVGWLTFCSAFIVFCASTYMAYLILMGNGGYQISEMFNWGSTAVLDEGIVEQEQVSETKDIPAMVELMYLTSNAEERLVIAKEILTQERSNSDALYVIGMAFQSGLVVSKDEKAAMVSFNLAAGDGHEKAQLELAEAYKNGRGIAVNLKQAAYWYKEAAGSGNLKAQFNIGLCYEHGMGVEKNLNFAKIWYKKAEAKGNENAAKALQRLRGEY